MRAGLEAMQKYLDLMRLGSQSGSLDPKAVSYLTAVITAARRGGKELGVRSERKLRTLSEAIDLLLLGRIAEAGDLFTQRFKSIQCASADGDWKTARHLELIPGTLVSAVPQAEQSAALSLELCERKMQALSSYRDRGARH